MREPDYLICLECDSPSYAFEWRDGKVLEAVCSVCGNDRPEEFMTPEDLEELDGH